MYNSVFHWLAERNLRTPDDISVVQLEWRASRPDVAGMNQHNDLVGEAAVDMVIAQIRNEETGLSTVPRATLITATWMSGKSVQPRAIKV